MALEKELETYRRLLPTLQVDEGKFALIRGDELIGIFGTYEDALAEGYKTARLEPFLVQQIHASEQVHLITRLLETPCRTSSRFRAYRVFSAETCLQAVC